MQPGPVGQRSNLTLLGPLLWALCLCLFSRDPVLSHNTRGVSVHKVPCIFLPHSFLACRPFVVDIIIIPNYLFLSIILCP